MRIRCFALTALAPTALVAVQLSSAHTRGRLALQAGTSVQSNYAGEPRSGGISGPELTRHIQEAVVGVRAKSHLWIDAGIYLSHIGQESWISRDGVHGWDGFVVSSLALTLAGAPPRRLSPQPRAARA